MTGAGVPVRGHLDQTACQEQVSLAYAHAVASAAGCAFERRSIDHYGVDASFEHMTSRAACDAIKVEAQFKCTTQDVLRTDHLAFGGLKKTHHEDLRTTMVSVPRILVVMLAPPNMDDWLQQTETELLVSGCAYWVSLRDQAEIATATTTVHIPRKNVFSTDGLLEMFERLRLGGLP